MSADQLTLFAGDSRASRSVTPGSGAAQKMTAISGQKCSALSSAPDPLGSLVRTLLESSAWNSTRCYLTWKPAATPANRLLFRLVPSMPRTDETESGFFATATATANQLAPSMMKHKGCRQILWGTPRAADGMSHPMRDPKAIGNPRGRLEDQVAMLPTPTACMHKGSSPASLTRKSGRSRENDRLDHKMQALEGSGCLNPQWVEWLQGFPVGWTDLSNSGTQ